MKLGRDVTKTRLVFEYLLEHEFSRRAVIASATKLPLPAVTTCLHNLRHYQAVDVVIEADGVGWWFATPESDTRLRHIDERKPLAHSSKLLGRKPGSKNRSKIVRS